MLDGNFCLNLVLFVMIQMVFESDKFIMSFFNKNYIDIDEYFIIIEFQIRIFQFVDKSNVGVLVDVCGIFQIIVYCVLY